MEKEKAGKEKTTATADFIPSLDNWIISEKQRERAKKLANMTENNRGKKL